MKRSDIGTVSGFPSAGFAILESGVQEKFGIEGGFVSLGRTKNCWFPGRSSRPKVRD